MTPESEMIQKIIDGAKMNVKLNAELLPVFFIVNDSTKTLEIVGAHMENERAKDMTAKAVGELAKAIEADFIVFVTEAYVVEGLGAADVDAVYKKYGSLRNHPDAKERVVFTIETKTRQHTGFADILKNRELGEVKWLEPELVEGRFSNLLGKKPTKH